MSEVHVYVWKGSEVKASVYKELDLPDGARVRPELRGVSIMPGDYVALDYGRSLGTYTETGRGYRSEFPNGKIVLHGVGAALELKAGEVKHVELIRVSNTEFEKAKTIQAQRAGEQITLLGTIYIQEEMERRAQKAQRESQQVIARDKLVRDALEEMHQVLRKKKM